MKYSDFAKTIRQGVKLVAVSKTHPAEIVQEAYNDGLRVFGENKPQELAAKYQILPKDIEWHFIGHLQTNKIKIIIPFVSLIHSIDSPHLMAAVNNEAAKINRIIPCLLQVHIAQEETKFGFAPNELLQFLQTKEYEKYSFIKICGLMGMATNTSNTEQVRGEFHSLKTFFDNLKSDIFKNNDNFTELSMGMSHDYKIAIEEGATIVRVGTLLFGQRDYDKKK